MKSVPVLFIIFNRPDTTATVFDVIRAAKPSHLYIAADAPRPGNINDEVKCAEARAITETIDWPCTVNRLYRNENLGCGLAVSGAINWFFSFEEEGIILEDDCLPHPHFFDFASEMLLKYKNDSRIISINGSNLGYESKNGDSYCFSRYMNMWGWATWRDRAMRIDYEMQEWKRIDKPMFWLYKKMKQYFFDFDINWFKLWKSKFDFVSKDINFTWDWQWIYHQMANRKLSIVPGVNLVSNIGFNEDATHTLHQDNPAANIPTKAIRQPLKHPSSIQPDFLYEEQYVKWVWCYHKRMKFISFLILETKTFFKS